MPRKQTVGAVGARTGPGVCRQAGRGGARPVSGSVPRSAPAPAPPAPAGRRWHQRLPHFQTHFSRSVSPKAALKTACEVAHNVSANRWLYEAFAFLTRTARRKEKMPKLSEPGCRRR